MSGQQSSTYVQRAITVTVQLGEGTYGNSGFNTVKVAGLRIVAHIQKLGPPDMGKCSLRIYGLSSSLMQQLSTLGVPLIGARRNKLLIEAGDAVNGMSAIYLGEIYRAFQAFNDMPETFLQVEGIAGYYDAMAAVPPTGFQGAADVATIMSGFATQMGLAFENNGVNVKLSNPYFAGTLMEQAQSCARAANINMVRDDFTLAIWPQFGSRGGAIPLISAGTGLVGYPDAEEFGISFRCLFNPSIRIGGQIQMQSTLAPPPPSGQNFSQQSGPNGMWTVNALTYELASQLVGGPWFCHVGCSFTPGGPAMTL